MKLKHHQKICGNEWFSYLSFSNTHSCSFLNGSVWLELAESAAGRVVLLQLLSIHNRAVGITNLGVMLLWTRPAGLPRPKASVLILVLVITRQDSQLEYQRLGAGQHRHTADLYTGYAHVR